MQLFVKNPAKISNLEVDADLNLLSTFRLLNLLNPTLDQHASTKKYTDDAMATRLWLYGGTMSGTLNMGAQSITGLPAPSGDNDAVRKTYVDTAVGLLLPKAGGIMSGTLDMDNNIILDCLLPAVLTASDVLVKDYTITQVSTTGTTPELKSAWTFTVPMWVAAGSTIRTRVELINDGSGSCQMRVDVAGVPGTPTGTSSATWTWVARDITVNPGDEVTFYHYSSDAGTVSMRNQQLLFDSHVKAPTTQGWRI